MRRAPAPGIAALPDRIKGVALPGEYHEALAALLLEQPRLGSVKARDFSGMPSGTSGLKRNRE